MKLARFIHNNVTRCGMVDHGKVHPLAGTIFDKPIREGLSLPLDEVKIIAPVMPSKAVCVGLNYRDHAAELGIPVPEEPVFFMKPSSAVIGAGEHIVYPREFVTQLDYEAELAVVIGKTARHLSEDEAGEYILGYTVANDVTARNLQPKHGQWTISKSFDTFLPVGPWLETKLDPDRLDIILRVNGEIKQRSNTAELIVPIPAIISYLSKVMTLYPGDLILTGTPSGVGPLHPGDCVAVEVEGIGVLANDVVPEE